MKDCSSSNCSIISTLVQWVHPNTEKDTDKLGDARTQASVNECADHRQLGNWKWAPNLGVGCSCRIFHLPPSFLSLINLISVFYCWNSVQGLGRQRWVLEKQTSGTFHIAISLLAPIALSVIRLGWTPTFGAALSFTRLNSPFPLVHFGKMHNYRGHIHLKTQAKRHSDDFNEQINIWKANQVTCFCSRAGLVNVSQTNWSDVPAIRTLCVFVPGTNLNNWA